MLDYQFVLVFRFIRQVIWLIIVISFDFVWIIFHSFMCAITNENRNRKKNIIKHSNRILIEISTLSILNYSLKRIENV
jgi:hypothetical protein